MIQVLVVTRVEVHSPVMDNRGRVCAVSFRENHIVCDHTTDQSDQYRKHTEARWHNAEFRWDASTSVQSVPTRTRSPPTVPDGHDGEVMRTAPYSGAAAFSLLFVQFAVSVKFSSTRW